MDALRDLAPSVAFPSAPAALVMAQGEAALVKPTRPTKPPAPDLRKVSDATTKAKREVEYVVKLLVHTLELREYNEVLYPAYRQAQKRAARPDDDGARAVQRRQLNPQSVAKHAERESNRIPGEVLEMQKKWERALAVYLERCIEDIECLKHLGKVLQMQDGWGVVARRMGAEGHEYKLRWLNPDTEDETSYLWATRSVLEKHLPYGTQVQLTHLDAKAEGKALRRGTPITGGPFVPFKRVVHDKLLELECLSAGMACADAPLGVLSGGEEASWADVSSWANLVHGEREDKCENNVGLQLPMCIGRCGGRVRALGDEYCTSCQRELDQM